MKDGYGIAGDYEAKQRRWEEIKAAAAERSGEPTVPPDAPPNAPPSSFDPLLWMRRVSALFLLLFVCVDPRDIDEGFKLLRWIVTISAAWQLWQIRTSSQPIDNAWKIALGLVAVLFNPIQPFYFSREIWIGIDLLSAFVIGWKEAIIAWLFVTRNSSKQQIRRGVIVLSMAFAFFLVLAILSDLAEKGRAEEMQRQESIAYHNRIEREAYQRASDKREQALKWKARIDEEKRLIADQAAIDAQNTARINKELQDSREAEQENFRKLFDDGNRTLQKYKTPHSYDAYYTYMKTVGRRVDVRKAEFVSAPKTVSVEVRKATAATP